MRGKPYRFARYARGLNTADGPYGLREGFDNDPSGLGSEARALLNVVSRHRGNVSRRDGCSLLFNSDNLVDNLVGNPGFETNLTGWAADGFGAVLSRTTTDGFSGSASMNVLVPGTKVLTGAIYSFGTTVFTAGQEYRASVWLRGTVGGRVAVALGDEQVGHTTVNHFLTDDWTLVGLSWTPSIDADGVELSLASINNPVTFPHGLGFDVDEVAVVAADAAALFKDLSIIGNGATSFAIASTDVGSLYAIDADLHRVELEADLSTDAPWTFLRLPAIGAQGPAYGMNGTDGPIETDGTAVNTGTWSAVTGTLPNGTLLEYHDNELWVAGVAASPYSIFWSELGDPTNWPVENVTEFNPDGGLPITAMRSTGPYLLVFKERGIWSIYNAETSANRKFVDGAGTLSPRSVVATSEGCFFLDPQQGVMVTDGNKVDRISIQIQPTLDRIAAPDLASVTGAFHNGHYYLSAKIDGVETVLDYDTDLKSWWVHSPPMLALATWDRGTTLDLVGISAAAGEAWHLFKPGELTDVGEVFESYWSAPFHALGAPHLRKRVRFIHMDGRGRVDLYVARDYAPDHGALEGLNDFSAAGGGTFGGDGTFGDPAGTFGGGGGVGEDTIYSLGVARAWSPTFYSSRGEYWEMDAYTIGADTRKA